MVLRFTDDKTLDPDTDGYRARRCDGCRGWAYCSKIVAKHIAGGTGYSSALTKLLILSLGLMFKTHKPRIYAGKPTTKAVLST
jgi:hypothetical protein